MEEKHIYKGTNKTPDSIFFFKILAAEEFDPEINLSEFSEKEIKDIKSLSNKIDKLGLSALSPSIAPNVHGYEHIKDAVSIQAAQSKNIPFSDNLNKSNILIIGDPGTAKSFLIKFMEKVSQGVAKASGSGSSGVGLTASVEKEGERWVLKPGTLVLARELAIFEELNLISPEDLGRLQEGMSECQVSINKASIHDKLKVTCGVLAAANPINGKFNDIDPLTKQFNLPPQMLNRFDMVFDIKDVPNKEFDRQVAKKMFMTRKGLNKSQYDTKFLKKFFLYIRSQPEPKFPDNLEEYIIINYQEKRQTASKDTKVNARFNDAVMKCAVGHAKLRISKYVEKKDIDAAVAIMKKTYYQFNVGRLV